ncbi:MAG TPA: hypothetical protein VG406_13065 [Isosphaeraceae bacterium]|nr:hypothetical protein [Isosphaeraceae bacterium]
MARGASPARRRWPGGLLAMLALVAVIESAIARGELACTSPWAQDWRQTGRAARGESPGRAILCFGDSLAKFGVHPPTFEARLGHRAYGLALGAGTAPASYYLLRRALGAGARPEAVLVDYEPHILADDPRASSRLWPELLTPGEAVDLAVTTRDASLLAWTLVAGLLPSARDRFEIREALGDALRGEPSPRGLLVLAHWRNWQKNLGGQLMAPNSKYHGEPDSLVGANRILYPKSWEWNAVNVRYVRRFLALAARRGVPVFWLIPPAAPELQRRRERSGADAAFEAFVRAIAADFPGVTVLDARRSGYVASRFIDPIHLDRDGALAFSDDLADAVGRRLAEHGNGPRWEALPAYRARPTSGRFEDLEQSALALLAAQRGSAR